jgi:hypothetical protein
MLGFIHYQHVVCFAQSIFSSIEALLLPKKIVFRVGKKAVEEDILFDKFWLCDGLFEQLGNVYGFSVGFIKTSPSLS